MDTISAALMAIFAERYSAKMMTSPAFNPALKYVMRVTWCAGTA